MNVQKLITPFGEIVLKTHPLFNQMKDGINTTAYQNVNSDITILDMANLKYRYLKDGDTKFIPKQEENGQDGMESGSLRSAALSFTILKPTSKSVDWLQPQLIPKTRWGGFGLPSFFRR